MRKEILFAIIAGGAFGLLIAFGAWKANNLLKPKPANNASPAPSTNITANPIATSNTNQQFKIALESPQNLQLLTDTPVAVNGVTNPNTWVVVSGESSDSIINASASGSFSANVDLEGGANQIVVSAFDANGNEADANLELVFSSQFHPDATQSAQPISYLGTVTDISDSVIQIKNDNGDIEQVSPTANANFVDTRNNSVKNITQADVAIGDYLIAMGYKDGNNILQSSRVVVADAVTKTDRLAFYGLVTDVETTKVTVKNPKTNATVAVTGKNLPDLNVGDKIIAVGDFQDGTIDGRTIQILK